MTYTEAKAKRDVIYAELSAANLALKAWPANEIGLHSDAVRALPEYQAAKARSAAAFASLRKFNAVFVPRFKKEISADRHYV